MQITSDIELSGAGCTTAITPNQLVQSSSENDIYYQPGPFVHSKLLVVDDTYAQIGSANLDARSLRLNFEVVVEIIDANFAAEQVADLKQKRAAATQITLAELDKRGFFARLRDGVAWLVSPYL